MDRGWRPGQPALIQAGNAPLLSEAAGTADTTGRKCSGQPKRCRDCQRRSSRPGQEQPAIEAWTAEKHGKPAATLAACAAMDTLIDHVKVGRM